MNKLKLLGVRIIFEQEELDTNNNDSDLIISIIEAFAQAENDSRSDNIKWSIEQRAADGSSKLYNRKCYGYMHDKKGNLIIDEIQSKNVQMIFDLYLQEKALLALWLN